MLKTPADMGLVYMDPLPDKTYVSRTSKGYQLVGIMPQQMKKIVKKKITPKTKEADSKGYL